MPELAEKTESKRDVADFLSTARERYQAGLDADQVDRDSAERDNVFANASDINKEQWDPIPLASRQDNHRPVLQWNRIPTYVQQVVNDGRQNKPAIKISAGDGGDKPTAEFYQSRIRQIEYDCDADIAYDTAREQQVTSGRGFIRVWADYIPGTFQQKLCIDRIDNQFSVVFDPGAKRYDRSDADFCFVVTRISRDEFKRRYGAKSLYADIDFASSDNPCPDWIGVGDKGDMVQIAEYWHKKYRKRTLALLQNGQTAWRDSMSEEDFQQQVALDGLAKPITREEQDATVCRYIINGAEILEEGEWLGSTIPIVPVWGREAVVNGIRRTFSLIRQAKDPQRLVNLYVSNIAEQIAMMPKAPYEAPVGSIAPNHEPSWRDAGQTAKAILYYLQYDEEGRALERPSRIVTEPPIQALSIGLSQAIDAIKAAMGIFDASLGARSNETSGVAIERRKKSAEIVNFHFPDNENRSRKRIGEILIELIPLLDKPGSRVPIRFEDGKTEVVPVGEVYVHPKTGKEVIHNLGQGTYGIVVSTQTSYESARAEEHERLVALVEAEPQLLTVIGDQVIRTSDFPGSEDIAMRMENWIKKVNPGVIQDQEQQAIPPQAQNMILGLQQKIQELDAFAQSLHQKLETKQPELDNQVKLKQMDLDFQREKLKVDNTTKIAIEELKIGIEADLEVLRGELARIEQQQNLSHAQQMAEDARQHESEQADAQRAADLEASKENVGA